MIAGDILIDIILALVALGVLVTVHETGHFLAARLCGVKVETFSIGFGSPLLKFVKNEIEYRIGWIPLGGYVKMKGEALEEGAAEEADSFQYTKWWKKIIISLAGPFSNLVLAVLIFILTFLLPSRVEDHYPVVGQVSGDYELIFQVGDSIHAVNGKPVEGWYQFLGSLSRTEDNSISLSRDGKNALLSLPQLEPETFIRDVQPSVTAVVGEMSPGMPAWRAGLKPGDKIIRVNNVEINNWYDMRELITLAEGDSVSLTLVREGQTFERTMPLEQNPMAEGQRLIGITQYMPVTYTLSYPPGKAVQYGVSSTLNFIALNYIALYRVISRPETLKSSVGGPVMIYSLSSQSAKKGWTSWITFLAAISIVLMIMNLLPIPVLDGGHIMFALVQGVIGKPIPRRVQLVLQNIGLVLLLMLMTFAFYNDFSKVFSRAVSSAVRPM